MNVRLVSLFILLLGLVIAYFAIYSPLQAARAGLPDLSVSMKGVVVTPGFLLVGLCGLVFAPAGVLTPAQGGTGQTTTKAALRALGIYVQPTAPAHAVGRVWIPGTEPA
jgi:hypothetical protein